MPTHLGPRPSFNQRYTPKPYVYKPKGTLSRGRNKNRGVLSELHTKANGYRSRSPNLNNVGLAELNEFANNTIREPLKSPVARRFIDPSMYQNTRRNAAGGKKRKTRRN
jgi:hypothetical protein